jgi:diaminopimelate epimerase
MSIRFTKLSATGNDFILFDNRENLFRGDEEQLFRALCTRRLAIGADGILLIEKPRPSSRITKLRFTPDFIMRYFNRDGRESEMCGNGARASAYYAFHRRLAPAEMQFEVSGDLYQAMVAGNKVRLRLQKPRQLDLAPAALEETAMAEGGFVNTGVPHYVLFVSDIAQIDVEKVGKKYRQHPAFQPAGTNVNFVAPALPDFSAEENSGSYLHLRTYERGVEEETLACGTGAVASAILAHLKKSMPFPIHLTTAGGELTVYGDSSFEKLELEGEVRLVYDGEFELENFSDLPITKR